jgi:glucosamine-6-phosphate deaminase
MSEYPNITLEASGVVNVPGELRQKERITTHIFTFAADASKYVATEIANLIRTSPKPHVVLGLATGSTPTAVYAELVRMHKQEGLSFKNVVTFNLDEYYPMKPDQLQSYHRFMNEHLFNHIDIPRENVHIPDGTLPEKDVEKFCFEYEQNIVKYGGIDIQILGIGKTGHIGFNEPGSSNKSITRLLYLDKVTRLDAASDFFNLEAVPRRAITMGVGTILAAKKVFMLAFSEGKSNIVKKAVEGPVDRNVAASFLQEHPNSQVVLDMPAATQLTRVKSPWLLIGNSSNYQLDFDERTMRRAVIWLSLHTNKPLLKLTEDDYIEANLTSLLNKHGPVHKLNVKVFSYLKSTITGWPGGKPSQEFINSGQQLPKLKFGGTTTRIPTDYVLENYKHINPEVNPNIKNQIFPKRVLIFSPHPDDDVISMGGTMIRLVEQGHIVHVAYQTSGDIAVWDDDVRRFANFAAEFAKQFNLGGVEGFQKIEQGVEHFLDTKSAGQVDSAEIRKIKSLIRSTEARSAARYTGVHSDNIHFLELPFYETGTVKKKPLGEEDVRIVAELLHKVQPHQIYAAGDLSDPHGTHRVCLQAVMKALHVIKTEEWFKECQLWLYRGAWQEWDPEDIEMAIPMSPQELEQKRFAIFKHQSQKDTAPFPGGDKREFWVRAEARNRATAKLYDQLGLPEYEAVEAFVSFDINKPNNSLPL